jgi:DNA damage-binding protein 1
MGCTVGANSISYLDNGVVFLGSAMGDSQIVRLLTDPDAESGNFFEILEVQANLAPILDFACVDLEGQGQDQVVACCGALREGTLRIVRNGIGVNMEAELPLPNITGVWSMRASSAAEFDKYLCVSFASQTVFLAMEDDEDLAELQECGGLVSDSRTLFCGTTVGDQIVQVHAGGVRLVKASSLALSDQWQPPEGRQITVCCVNTLPRGQIAVAVGGTLLVCLRVDGMSLRQTASCTLRHEIACMDMTPLVPGEDSTVLAVGFWSEYSVSVLELPSLKTLVSEPLMAGNVVPRSVRLANLDGQPRVLVGLGDGRLVHYRLQGTHELVERKTVPLGTKAVLLTPFVSAGGAASIFVGCDRPAVIYSGARKLLTSNVNQKNVSFVTSFHTAQFPHCLAMATGEALVVGRLQSLQKLHVDTIRLGGEMARRLAHHAPARAFAIGTTSGNVMGRDPSPVQSQLRLLDQAIFFFRVCVFFFFSNHEKTGHDGEARFFPIGARRTALFFGFRFSWSFR